jgi:hypothetical protein
MKGHSASVYGVAVTPDGKRAVSASRDKTLKVWDLDTGRALRTLEGHSASVSGVAVTPDGKRAVSASEDNTLKVWDLETGLALVIISPRCGRIVLGLAGGHKITSAGDAGGRLHFSCRGADLNRIASYTALMPGSSLVRRQDGEAGPPEYGRLTREAPDIPIKQDRMLLEGGVGGNRSPAPSIRSSSWSWYDSRRPHLQQRAEGVALRPPAGCLRLPSRRGRGIQFAKMPR